MQIIDGKATAAAIKAEIAEENFERKNENNSNRTIKDIYISNLKEDIKEKLNK